MIVAIGTNEQFTRFCSAAGLPDAGRPTRATRRNPQRVEHRLELVARLAAAIAQRPTAEWLAVLETANVPGRAGAHDPRGVRARARTRVVEHAHPRLGPVRTVRSPIGLDGTYPTAVAAPPLLGQHTAEVLAELGLRRATSARRCLPAPAAWPETRVPVPGLGPGCPMGWLLVGG